MQLSVTALFSPCWLPILCDCPPSPNTHTRRGLWARRAAHCLRHLPRAIGTGPCPLLVCPATSQAKMGQVPASDARRGGTARGRPSPELRTRARTPRPTHAARAVRAFVRSPDSRASGAVQLAHAAKRPVGARVGAPVTAVRVRVRHCSARRGGLCCTSPSATPRSKGCCTSCT